MSEKFKFKSEKPKEKWQIFGCASADKEIKNVKGPRLELFGNREIIVEGCMGVFEYSDTYMKLKLPKGSLTVCGCNFETVDESGASGDNLPCYCSGVFKGSEVLPSYFSEESFLPSSVNKLYKREIAEKYGIRFDESLQIGEDFMFNYCFFKHSSCVCSMSDKLYYYFCSRSGSASNSLSKKWLLRWKNTKFVLEQEKGNEQVHMLCSRMYAKELLLCYKEMNEYKIAREMKDLYLQLVSEMKENAQQFINNPLLGKSDKLKYRLFVISPVLLNLMRAINKIRTIPKR